MSDDRAVEVLARRLHAERGLLAESPPEAMAVFLVEALASAGLQITDLTERQS